MRQRGWHRIWAAAGAVILACASGACRRQDIRTVLIHVPAMGSQDCADIAIRSLGRRQGIPRGDIEVDLAGRNLIVKYDSLERSLKNLEFSVADAGFDANDVPADPKARAALPPGCGGAGQGPAGAGGERPAASDGDAR